MALAVTLSSVSDRKTDGSKSKSARALGVYSESSSRRGCCCSDASWIRHPATDRDPFLGVTERKRSTEGDRMGESVRGFREHGSGNLQVIAGISFRAGRHDGGERDSERRLISTSRGPGGGATSVSAT
ncbi:uncharacterized protein LOC143901837 isoform X1 [Temnothorax americanus]|uniref:uncharacterized protein LOC143901837 isoform X1 n=1 Tax=Temnothorax americanus TaxID=1964332 RepID=UPI004067F2E8